jgi:hypothetical protein
MYHLSVSARANDGSGQMGKRTIVGIMVLALSGLFGATAPAHASCNEVGDPACTVGGGVNAALCTAQELAKSGGKPSGQDIADCFTQTTGGGNRSSDIVDTGIVEKVECFFRVYIQEGGESGLDCLT